jgi:hypothetical protein
MKLSELKICAPGRTIIRPGRHFGEKTLKVKKLKTVFFLFFEPRLDRLKTQDEMKMRLSTYFILQITDFYLQTS